MGMSYRYNADNMTGINIGTLEGVSTPVIQRTGNTIKIPAYLPICLPTSSTQRPPAHLSSLSVPALEKPLMESRGQVSPRHRSKTAEH